MIKDDNELFSVTNEDLLHGTFFVPENVTSISEKAFQECTNVKEIIVHGNVVNIEYEAFKHLPYLTTVKFNGTKLKTINDNLFKGCFDLTTVELPEGLETINTGAFEDCFYLKEINIPDSVKTIYDEAFKNCSALTQVKLPKDLDVLSPSTFESGKPQLCTRTLSKPACANNCCSFAG